jgi:predicted membrane-bound dolichyl-phosphate-mannose-protein mannosyltransferase
MVMLEFLAYLVAFLCFLAAAFAADRWPRVNLIALGLAAWVLVSLAHAWPG